MTREEFKEIAMSMSHGYSEEDVEEVLSQLSDEEAFPGAGITEKEMTLQLWGCKTEEEWLDLQAENLPCVTMLEGVDNFFDESGK